MRDRRIEGFRLDSSYAYRDTGCEVAPRCQDCPLPVCKHEGADTFMSNAERYAQLTAAAAALPNVSLEEKARRLGVSYSMLNRAMRATRKAAL